MFVYLFEYLKVASLQNFPIETSSFWTFLETSVHHHICVLSHAQPLTNLIYARRTVWIRYWSLITYSPINPAAHQYVT